MVYYLQNLDIPARVPADWVAFWDQSDFALDMIRCDFEKDLQSREEALEDNEGQQRQRDHLIRFRKSDDPDQIAYFYGLGRRTFEIVEELVAEREWTPELAHYWSVLMFAHGFIMPSAFAQRDDLDNDRRGARGREATSREAQRRWYAHYLVREFKRGVKRATADERILRLVNALSSGELPPPAGFDADWFKGLKDERGRDLSSTLGLIGRPKAMAMVAEGTDGLPPIDLAIP
jgi:hypothetical protein